VELKIILTLWMFHNMAMKIALTSLKVPSHEYKGFMLGVVEKPLKVLLLGWISDFYLVSPFFISNICFPSIIAN